MRAVLGVIPFHIIPYVSEMFCEYGIFIRISSHKKKETINGPTCSQSDYYFYIDSKKIK